MKARLRTWAALTFLLAACDGGGTVTLLVDVKTDLVPGVEFTAVETVRLVSGAPVELRPLTASLGDDYVSGQRVAELRDLPRGDHTIEARLLDASGAPVLSRLAIVSLRGNAVVTLVLTRSCQGVVCPGAGDDPAAIACLGGVCVDPRCTPEAPERCPAPACVAPDACPMPAEPCVDALCEEGVCLEVGRSARCAPAEACVPGQGCIPIMSVVPDAGMDGGALVDAPGAMDAPPGVDAPPGTDAGTGFFDAGTTTGTVLWGHGFGGDNDGVHDVLIDDAGAVVVVGGLSQSADLGLGNVPAGGFVAAYDAAGTLQWVTPLGDNLFGLDQDGAGNLFVGGYFTGNITVGASMLSSAGGADPFVARLDPGGTPVWGASIGSPASDWGWDVAVDPAGNVYGAGYLQGVAGTVGGPIGGGGLRDAFVASWDAAGTPKWALAASSTNNDEGRCLAVDTRGRLIFGGRAGDGFDLGLGAMPTANGSEDMFLASIDPNGTALWVRTAGVSGTDGANAVAVDPAGDIVVTGITQNGVDFGTGPLTTAGGLDAFLARYDDAGNIQSAALWGGMGTDDGRGVAVSPSGTQLMVGYFSGTADFGTGPVTAAMFAEPFAAAYGRDGTPLFTWQLGADNGRAFAVATNGDRTVIGGSFVGTVDLGAGPVVGTGINTAFLAVLD